ncbi:MAG: class II aldolase/adducin family protein [Deltaproteobacteria bacterium]|nr:class II aldolase/adducin family protein [Deltaproteobacteria bacterium]
MNSSFSHYSEKLTRAGLAETGTPLLGFEEEPVARNRQDSKKKVDSSTIAMPGEEKGLYAWNREDPLTGLLTKVGERLGRRAILYSQPAEPYHTMLLHMTETADGGDVIHPQDFETRIFLKDLPILKDLTVTGLSAALKDRRCVVIPGGGVIATAKKDMETAFVIYSAACFAVFVKFFSDMLRQRQLSGPSRQGRVVLDTIMGHLDPVPPAAAVPNLSSGPWEDEAAIRAAMAAAGKRTVSDRLVDANFGNISYRRGEDLFITRKGSALDALADRIIRVPLAGPADTDAIASTELPAHRLIARTTPYRAVLHGHPKFSVIMSMACGEEDCPDKGGCHRFCPRERWIQDIPVVSGEAGAGPFGLCNTVPAAVRDHGAAIVYGHGVFTAGAQDFNEALQRLRQIEKTCRDLFFRTIGF